MLGAMQRKFYIVFPVLLAGCFYNQTDIQGDYEVSRKECQALAETKIDQYDTPERHVSEKSRNAELVTLFSDCMAKSGWQVATPKREKTKKPVAATPVPAPQPVPQQPMPVPTQATPLTPAPSMPPLRQPADPNAAMYQPAPYNPQAVPYYGSGPGRSF